MNEPLDEQQKQLEMATSCDPRWPIEMENDTATMRESWLALTGLLAAADAEQDTPVQLLATRADDAPARRTIVSAAALAVCLLVAAAIGWGLPRLRFPQPVGPPLASPSGQPGSDQLDHASSDTSPIRSSDELAWDAPFDQQLADARYALFSAPQRWHRDSVAFDAVRDQLQQIEQELESGSL